MSSRASMTGWYDPRRLLSIGIRVAEATVFGEMFDHRELMASLDPFDKQYFDENLDFTDKPPDQLHAQTRKYTDENDNFWLDYTADTGDGWSPVYAVARLLARQTLYINDTSLSQVRLLVFGGDQVYPTASKEDYDAKLQAPFRAANLQENSNMSQNVFDQQKAEFKDRYLFALPGNHDWYDDLTAFTHMFCNKAPERTGSMRSPGRFVCGRETRQTRSYFALKLPHDWWLCAFDAQLAGFIDAPQLRYFEYVAQNLMSPGSNIILCCAGPVWAYSRRNEQAEGFSNFAFASLIATGAVGYNGYRPERQHKLRLVLTGDAHHYAHYIERAADYGSANSAVGDSKPEVHYLTCGLGGAFSHPTHWLDNTAPRSHWRPAPPIMPYDPNSAVVGNYTRRFRIATDADNTELLFPDRERSRAITWRNLLFGWLNPWFGVFTGAIGLFATWLLHFGALVLDKDLVELLGRPQFFKGMGNLLWLLVHTPWPALIVVGTFFAFSYFADFDGSVAKRLVGAAHTFVHVAIYSMVLVLLSHAVARLPAPWDNDAWVIAGMAIAFAVLTPFVLGAYLLIMLNGFGRHWNEAYSALRIEDFKGFLRLKIDATGNLAVYPIVLDNVPRSDDGPLPARLFEGPILIPR